MGGSYAYVTVRVDFDERGNLVRVALADQEDTDVYDDETDEGRDDECVHARAERAVAGIIRDS